jgi:hypothetical protein
MQRVAPLVLMALTATGSLFAQTVVRSKEQSSCSGCSVKLTKIATLMPGPDASTALPAHPTSVVRDSKGRIYMGFGFGVDKAVPRVFAADGKLIKLLGRSGTGPGEFQFTMNAVLMGGDSVMLLDTRHRYIVGPDLKIARSFPMESFMTPARDASVPGYMRIGAAGGDPTKMIVGFFDHNNKVAKRIEVPYAMRPTPSIPIMRFSAAGKDAFWWLMSNDYHIELWGIDGKRRLVIDREASWWLKDPAKPIKPDEFIEFRVGGMPSAPRSSLNDLLDDGRGHLWTIGRVLKKGLSPKDTTVKEDPMRHPYDRYDTQFEVFDALTGKLLITQRIDGYLSQILKDGYVVKLTDDAEARPVVEIWKAELVGVK